MINKEQNLMELTSSRFSVDDAIAYKALTKNSLSNWWWAN